MGGQVEDGSCLLRRSEASLKVNVPFFPLRFSNSAWAAPRADVTLTRLSEAAPPPPDDDKAKEAMDITHRLL